uniref:NADAR domain-containing protein n=1 Tax=Eutreptiella gymnastica TaxID=73025 RepID=A0A7S1ISA0_9EUGL|mmetsp:Transcript_38893/g.69611  ORF Transcript_38893/g.69611 Transcript_38893/m.69611 type:complete len:437 (+) Transcript_38893:115-1425(+)
MTGAGYPYRDEPQDEVVVFSEGDIPYGVFHSYTLYGVFIDGKDYPTLEHYYQAMKFTGTGLSEQIRMAPSPAAAVQMANHSTHAVRGDWEGVKYDCIERGIYAKFTQHPELRDILMSTGHSRLNERRRVSDSWDRITPESLCETLSKVRRQLFINTITKIRQNACKHPLPKLPPCPRMEKCKHLDDEVHKAQYCHPCPKGSHCTNPSPWHLQQFIHLDELKPDAKRQAALLHLPSADTILKPGTTAQLQVERNEAGVDQLHACSFNFECKLLAIPGHIEKYAHLCPAGTRCEDYTLDHRRQWMHADEPPTVCPEGEQCTLSDDVHHIMRYSHPCPAGVACTITSHVHLECFSHVIPPCAASSRCWRRQFKDHCNQFSHPCEQGARCPKRDHLLHSRRFTHDPTIYGRPLHLPPPSTPTLPAVEAASPASRPHSSLL